MKCRASCLGGFLLLLALGCDEATPVVLAPPDEPPPPTVENRFDPATAGAIRGKVFWQGAIPTVSAYRVSPSPVPGIVPGEQLERRNPNAPIVDPKTQTVGSAVVYLRGVDPSRARPWDHEPVRVELAAYGIDVGQQPGRPAYGFVRRGDQVDIVSRQPVFHSLHADGASFFTLAFPDPEQPLTRRLARRGLVELTSAAGYFWMRAYLFVDDHPYYAVTQPDGSFELPQVPPGDYELICWMPSWIEDRRNRDPEGGLVTRIFFRPPVETVTRVRVRERAVCEVEVRLSAKSFGR